jgi:hypothetical protein
VRADFLRLFARLPEPSIQLSIPQGMLSPPTMLGGIPNRSICLQESKYIGQCFLDTRLASSKSRCSLAVVLLGVPHRGVAFQEFKELRECILKCLQARYRKALPYVCM